MTAKRSAPASPDSSTSTVSTSTVSTSTSSTSSASTSSASTSSVSTSSVSTSGTDCAYEVRQSPVHGKGVFARRPIGAGERIVEYRGQRISWDAATERADQAGGPVNHTFYFSLADGRVIDGGRRGNEARWINHACSPNCEAYEEDGKVFIHALHDIDAGDELNYNYALIYEERHTPKLKKLFACRCGTPGCTGTMLAPKRRTRLPAASQQVSQQPAKQPAK